MYEIAKLVLFFFFFFFKTLKLMKNKRGKIARALNNLRHHQHLDEKTPLSAPHIHGKEPNKMFC